MIHSLFEHKLMVAILNIPKKKCLLFVIRVVGKDDVLRVAIIMLPILMVCSWKVGISKKLNNSCYSLNFIESFILKSSFCYFSNLIYSNNHLH